MDLTDFKEALASVKDRYRWVVKDNGAIRGTRPSGLRVCPITAIANAREQHPARKVWMDTSAYREAGDAIGLSYEDQGLIVDAADDRRSYACGSAFRDTLLTLLGLKERVDVQKAQGHQNPYQN